MVFAAALLSWVHPEVGTMNDFELSHGNVYPAMTLPWGMHAWSIQTSEVVTDKTKLENWKSRSWFYDWRGKEFRGFKMTHQPSPWMGDYGSYTVMPMSGEVERARGRRYSVYSHLAETMRPDYYCNYLPDCGVKVELTPSCRGAVMRFSYDAKRTPVIVVDGDEAVRPGKPDCHLAIEFDREVIKSEELPDGARVYYFAALDEENVITMKVAASFISEKQAKTNLGELEGTFGKVQEKAAAEWERVLGRLQVEGGSDDRKKMFYTCLYRSLIFPKKFYEIDERGEIVHWSPHTREVCKGRYFAGTGFWDTFRALYPLLTRVYPEIVAEMMEGLENCVREAGWLPEWSNPGFVDCMIGQNSASVVAGAYLGGVREGYDIEVLYEALVKGANAEHPEKKSIGRLGIDYYNRLGYVPRDVGIKESVARTLEYAYDDYAIALLAEELGKREDAAFYLRRSQNWKNVFDPARGLAVGRNLDGSFNQDFDPFAWGGDFTEGNSLHYSWSVFHDVPGLIDAMGGKAAFVKRLDELFTLPPTADWSAYGSRIHEILEMQLAGMGQYAHGNQPIQHAIYLYDFAGEREKMEKRLEEVFDRMYRPTPDGYCGDEDNGQTSAWYVWTALGEYPVCPVSGKTVKGKRWGEVKVKK